MALPTAFALAVDAAAWAFTPTVPASRAQQATDRMLGRIRNMKSLLARRNLGSGGGDVAQLPVELDQDEQAMAQHRVGQAGDHLHVGVQVVEFGGDGGGGIDRRQ